MIKFKYSLVIAAFALLFTSAKSQNLKVGTHTVGLGVNYLSYSFSSTNLCYLITSSGTMSGVSCVGSYSYAVLKNTTLGGSLGLSFLSGALGLDIGVGGEYHIHFGHRINKFDLYIPVNVGFTYINVQYSKISGTGTFKADGIHYNLGAGVRKYFKNNFGVFLNAGYAVHSYFGGEITETGKNKLPCTLALSGFYVGGGVCYRIGSTLHPLID